jgi:hypothetical protein
MKNAYIVTVFIISIIDMTRAVPIATGCSHALMKPSDVIMFMSVVGVVIGAVETTRIELFLFKFFDYHYSKLSI